MIVTIYLYDIFLKNITVNNDKKMSKYRTVLLHIHTHIPILQKDIMHYVLMYLGGAVVWGLYTPPPLQPPNSLYPKANKNRTSFSLSVFIFAKLCFIVQSTRGLVRGRRGCYNAKAAVLNHIYINRRLLRFDFSSCVLGGAFSVCKTRSARNFCCCI